jgi:tripartite ATP-independent transporter DctM subunit
MDVLILLISFLFLLFLGVPVAFSLGIPSLVYLLINGMPIEMIASKAVASLNSFPLLAVLFFVLAGNLMNEYGVSERIFKMADKTVGHFRGGLAHANILASVIFSGMSGAALADAAGLGTVEIREMTKRGYSREFSVGITGASSIIGPIIPPSIPIIIFAVVSGESVGKLFLGGVIPGLLMAILLGIMVVIIARRQNVPKLKKATFRQWGGSIKRGFPALITIIIILGGIFGGIFTPTEAAAVAVLYVLFLGILIYRQFTWKGLILNFKKSIGFTAKIMIIVACAALFGQVIIREQMAQTLGDFLLESVKSPILILLLINIFLLILGCFLEQIAAILVVTPIILPIVTGMGFSPIQFGIVIVINLMVGLLTPPFGLVLYTLSDVGELSLKRTIKGTVPFLIPLVACLLLLTYIPFFTVYLPGLFIG